MTILHEISKVIKRKFNGYYLDFEYTLGGIYHRNNFKDVRTMVLTIGINRSGSSLLGYLLTAHPNIVIADEIQHLNTKNLVHPGRDGIVYLREMYKGFLSNLFYAILDVDQFRYRSKISTTSLHGEAQQEIYKRNKSRGKRYILVPNQYQGCFERLKVIGVKASYENTCALLINNTLTSLNRKLKERDIKLKFLFTIRSPYELVARYPKKTSVEKAFQLFEKKCKTQKKILRIINPQDIFVNRHEDMCINPRRQLARLCDFMEVPIPAGYIEDCASQIVRKSSKRHLDIDWSPQLKQTVARMIEKYDFFSGYDWET